MSLEAAQYRGWTRRLLPSPLACWPIARTALVLVLRRKLFWLLLALAGLNFLFIFATIYLKAQIGAENPAIKRFVDQVLRSAPAPAKPTATSCSRREPSRCCCSRSPAPRLSATTCGREV